jgi:hypothetical protein
MRWREEKDPQRGPAFLAGLEPIVIYFCLATSRQERSFARLQISQTFLDTAERIPSPTSGPASDLALHS